MTKSEAVRRSMDFLAQVHRDVGALVQSVDIDADERGWASVHKNRISDDLSNALSPESWAIRYVTRIYTPRKVKETSSVAVAFLVAFQPEHHQEALALSVGARLRPAVSREGLWKQWKDVRPLLKHLSEQRAGGAVPIDVLTSGFSPSATAGEVFMAPLLELENMAIVRTRLIEPAFGAVA